MKEIYANWLKAKKAEEKAKKARIEIEQEMELLIPSFDGQSKTYSDEGFKVTVKKSETYSFDKDWDRARENIPENMRPERIKYEVDKAGLEYLKDSPNAEEQGWYKTISNFVSFKTGKTSFKVEKE